MARSMRASTKTTCGMAKAVLCGQMEKLIPVITETTSELVKEFIFGLMDQGMKGIFYPECDTDGEYLSLLLES